MASDVVVVGAGAGGLMAAGRAAEVGTSVLLLEKMNGPGSKIRISGKRRCNLTNSKDIDGFVLMYGSNGRFLYPAFNSFFRDDLLAFFRMYGVETKTEADGRIFPASDDAHDVLRALEAYLKVGHVHVRTGARVTEIVVDSGAVAGVRIGSDIITAKAVVLATGGCSYPGTGSSGDGYRIAATLGHHITRLRPALVQLVLYEEERARSLQGVSLEGIRLTSYRCASGNVTSSMTPAAEYGRGIRGKLTPEPVIESRRGDLIFTHFGAGGPVTLRMSHAVVEALEKGPVSVSIDLMPDESIDDLRQRLQSAFDRFGKKELRNILRAFLPQKVAKALPEIAGVSGTRLGSQLTSDDRESLVDCMKSLRFNIKSPRPISEAMVTAGGVSLREIDPRTMASRIVRGLFFCGEVMDIDAETGGYNLQAAFSTGRLAGQSAAALARHSG